MPCADRGRAEAETADAGAEESSDGENRVDERWDLLTMFSKSGTPGKSGECGFSESDGFIPENISKSSLLLLDSDPTPLARSTWLTYRVPFGLLESLCISLSSILSSL
jgi:hypothetical protein